VVRVELPGIAEKDIDVSITDDVLTIHGERAEEHETTEKGGYMVRESFHGSFERSLQLPPDVDPASIVASHHNGVLEIVVPKAAAMHERRTRHIELGTGEEHAGEM
jgi:HSP20 family protein